MFCSRINISQWFCHWQCYGNLGKRNFFRIQFSYLKACKFWKILHASLLSSFSPSLQKKTPAISSTMWTSWSDTTLGLVRTGARPSRAAAEVYLPKWPKRYTILHVDRACFQSLKIKLIVQMYISRGGIFFLFSADFLTFNVDLTFQIVINFAGSIYNSRV